MSASGPHLVDIRAIVVELRGEDVVESADITGKLLKVTKWGDFPN